MSQKSHSLKLFLWKNFFTLTAAFFAAFLSINFYSNEASALFVPTLSASVDQTNLQINGNQVINSTNKTTEIPLNLTVNTNNKTGYIITLNSETDENALVNTNSAVNAKIDSIFSASVLNNFPNNTWGVKFGTNANFSPIPKLTSPTNIAQTTTKTNGNEVSNINLGLKLGNNLESGSYKNKLIFSILTNRYDPIAKMATGQDFNSKLTSLETATNKIEHFKKSATAPAATMNAVNVEDNDSDYEIKLWLDPSDKTAYYYAEPEKVYLNEDNSKMFFTGTFLPGSHKDIKDLDLSNFDTSKVMTMNEMFANMYNLTSLNLSNFDTSKVTDMGAMFAGMLILTSLNLSNFDTSKVTDMYGMFAYMHRLTSLNLSNFDTSNVTGMRGMFDGMSSLTSLDLSNFDTSKVTDMGGMFSDMSNLTSLDLSNFNTSNVTDMSDMFKLRDGYASGDQLGTIYVKNDFDTTKLTNDSNMFLNRKKLRGGNGSYLVDPSTADKSWLRIDDPTHGRPGYFTRKP